MINVKAWRSYEIKRFPEPMLTEIYCVIRRSAPSWAMFKLCLIKGSHKLFKIRALSHPNPTYRQLWSSDDFFNNSILCSKGEYNDRDESHFACSSNYYVTWCPLTTAIVASQGPSSRDSEYVTNYSRSTNSMFSKSKGNSNTITDDNYEFENFIGSFIVHFHIKGSSNLSELVPVIGI